MEKKITTEVKRNSKGQYLKGFTGNPTGRKTLPVELHRLRLEWRAEFIRIFDRYAKKSAEELKVLLKEGGKDLPLCELLTVRLLIKATEDTCHHKFTLIKETLAGKDKGEIAVDYSFSSSEKPDLENIPKAKVLQLARKLLLEPPPDERQGD